MDGAADGGSMPEEDASAPCEGVCLRWPVAGTRGRDWVINNYVDLDEARRSLRDYRGNTGREARTYDGHHGVDIDIANFRAMDRGVEVVAAVAGVVRATIDDRADRNIACLSNDWNVVEIEDDDGYRYLYGHLRRGSVVVRRGERVRVGQALAQVGSSGCSTAAHLHFEVRSPAGAVVDPFLDRLWRNAPSYDFPLTIMDISLRSGSYSTVDELKDPGVDLAATRTGERVGIGISAAGGLPGDIMTFQLRDPSGSVFHSWMYTLERAGRHGWWMHNVSVGDTPGAWSAVGLTVSGERAIRFDVIR